MKTEVYSWRLSAHKKAGLETEARRDRVSLAKLLDEITDDWLAGRRNGHQSDEAEQAALRRRVMKTVGTLRGPRNGAETAREAVREHIWQRHLEKTNRARRRAN
ncbi:MAG TPA: hypothetical protein VF753_20530 [Terriglobales bacterium]